MKEATGEVSMTVITIVLVAIVLSIGVALFGSENAAGRRWIQNTFNNLTDPDNTGTGATEAEFNG